MFTRKLQLKNESFVGLMIRVRNPQTGYGPHPASSFKGTGGSLKPLGCDADPPPHISLWRVQSSFTSASFSMFNDVPSQVEEEHEVWDWPCIAQKYGRSAILKTPHKWKTRVSGDMNYFSRTSVRHASELCRFRSLRQADH